MNILKSISQLFFCIILSSEISFCSDQDQEDGEGIHISLIDETIPNSTYGTYGAAEDNSAVTTEITRDDLWEAFSLIKKELPLYMNENINPFFSHNVVNKIRKVKEYISDLTEIDKKITHLWNTGKSYDCKRSLEVERTLKESLFDIGRILEQGTSVRFSPIFIGMGGNDLLEELDELSELHDYSFRSRSCNSCYCNCCCCCDSCCCNFCGYLMQLGYDFCQSLVRDAAVFSLLLGGATSLLGWGSYEIYQQHWNSTGF